MNQKVQLQSIVFDNSSKFFYNQCLKSFDFRAIELSLYSRLIPATGISKQVANK